MTTTTTTTTTSTSIKHLVIAGGGPILIQTIGILQQLENKSYFKRSSIKSIYGTSAGGVVGMLYCLNYEWNIINNYVIGRPWNYLYSINTNMILQSYVNCGIFDKNITIKAFKPLLEAKDIDINITLKEFYELTLIELHLFTLDLYSFKTIDLSYLNFPEMKLLDAIHMTCAIPIIFAPIHYDNNKYCFIDGGVLCNYPLKLCLDKYNDPESTLGINNINFDKEDESTKLKINNLFDYMLYFMKGIIIYIGIGLSSFQDENKNKIKYEIITNETNNFSFQFISKVLSNIILRTELLQKGIDVVNNYDGFN